MNLNPHRSGKKQDNLLTIVFLIKNLRLIFLFLCFKMCLLADFSVISRLKVLLGPATQDILPGRQIIFHKRGNDS